MGLRESADELNLLMAAKRSNTPMKIDEWLKSNAEYGQELIESGVEGAREAAQEAFKREPAGKILGRAACRSALPAAVGAAVGSVTGYFGNKRQPVAGVIGGILLGGLAGFTCGLAWNTRRITGQMARRVMENVNDVRDAHWLETNPIDYA